MLGFVAIGFGGGSSSNNSSSSSEHSIKHDRAAGPNVARDHSELAAAEWRLREWRIRQRDSVHAWNFHVSND